MNTALIDYPFVGALAEHMASFIAEKRSVGRIYNTEGKKLYECSRMTEHLATTPNELSEDVVHIWLGKHPLESNRNQYIRFGVIKQFAEYMQRLGFAVYVPISDDISKTRHNFIPKILTHDEIGRLFNVIDRLKKERFSASPRFHIMMPLIFRLLYCCGLRASEATSLRISDVDTKENLLSVVNSKHGKTRYIPLTAELGDRLSNYIDNRPRSLLLTDFLFETPNGGTYKVISLYQTFRKFIYKAGIPHLGKGKGPRLHDLRHTFAVHCLQKWVCEGKDLTNAIPRLSAYLGHSDFQCTEPYLRMTAEVYPDVSAKLQEKYGFVLPKGEFVLEND